MAGIGPEAGRRASSPAGPSRRSIREIMLFLHGHGVGTSRAVRIFKTYGADAVQVITENPYRLARDIRGIGFRTRRPDRGEARHREDGDDPRPGRHRATPWPRRWTRAIAACRRTSCARWRRSCWRSRPSSSRRLWSWSWPRRRGGRDTVDEPRAACSWPGCTAPSRRIAERLLRLAGGTPPWPRDRCRARRSPGSSGRTGLTLAREPAGGACGWRCAPRCWSSPAAPASARRRWSTPSSGSCAPRASRCALAAPTGRAAKRLQRGDRAGGQDHPPPARGRPGPGGFKRDEEHPLDCDLLVVDETSMVDVPLMHALLKALPDEAALILVGDVDQLPSVGPGQVLADIIDSRRGAGGPADRGVPPGRRRAGSSPTPTGSTRARCPSRADEPAATSTSSTLPRPGGRARASCWRSWPERIPARFGLDPIRDVQVLCPMNRGGLGARSLNLELQQALNPPGEARVERFGWTFAPATRSCRSVNDYEQGRLQRRSRPGHGDRPGGRRARRSSFDGREVAYGFGELDELVLAYATTVHKARARSTRRW